MGSMDIDSDHLAIYGAESAALEPTDWEGWIAEVEQILGHSADGDQLEDGYSLDAFYGLWERRLYPAAAVGEVGSVAH